MTWTHEQSGLRKPTHGATQVRAVDGEDLEFLGRNPPHPARNIAGVAIPWAYKRIAIGRESCFAFRKLVERTQFYPGEFLFHLLPFGWAENVANHRNCEQRPGNCI